jgi:hypothetical protein
MYVHLGVDQVVNEDDIIGIFDLDSTTVSKHTRKFLNEAEKQKKVINVSFELPKSFVLCGKKKNSLVYISQLSSSTLYKRSKIL